MKFMEREETTRLTGVLTRSPQAGSEYLKISGMSGCGKTELVKHAVDQVIKADAMIVYINITEDIFQSSSFFDILCETVYYPIKHKYDTITNIPEGCALCDFLNKKSTNRSIKKHFWGLASATSSIIPAIGGPVSKAIDGIAQNESISYEWLINNYFKFIMKHRRVCLIVDNYQFLSQNMKRIFECGINMFNYGVSLIIIDRIVNKPDHTLSMCTSFHHVFLDIDYFSRQQYDLLMSNQDTSFSKEQLEKIWMVTNGNLKDLDILVNEVKINSAFNIADSSVAIKNLDSIQKYILIIASFFPAGMKEEFVIRIIREIASEKDETVIKNAIDMLVTIGYIFINGRNNDTVKPSHETVVNHVKDAIEQNDLKVFASELSDCLEMVIGDNHMNEDYAYLLHCWIGINTAEKLRENLSYVIELISVCFRENAYFHIGVIAPSIKEIIVYLPETTIEKILIAFQRISDFNTGISVILRLRSDDPAIYERFRIYFVKYLIQTYEFEEAINELKSMPVSSEVLLCKTNALAHLGKDNEVKCLLDSELPNCDHDENYYIILRNTAHCFDYETAKDNLLESLGFFSSKKHQQFAVATINNNLGVINIWNGDYEKAASRLDFAIDVLDSIGSNEVFEPYCNKSILLLLCNDYENAEACAQNALINCPRQLSLDIIMLKNNLIMAELISGSIHTSDALSQLKRLESEYRVIEDPWYRFQLSFNIGQLEALCDHLKHNVLDIAYERYVQEYDTPKTKYYILNDFRIENAEMRICLGLSPNWRY